MRFENIANRIAAAVILVLLGGFVWLYLIEPPPDAEPTARSRSADEQMASLVTERPDSRRDTTTIVADRDISPATDLPWRAPDVDAELLDTLLKNPASTYDVLDSVEWAETNAWVGVPDIDGQWSMARRQCAAEKLGTASQDRCYYNVNLVFQRRADGKGEVVGALADFHRSIIADEPDVYGPDPSLVLDASARCRSFARCLVARGYAGLVAPLAPGPEGELISLQIGGREVPRSGDGMDARQWLESAINETIAQIELHENNAAPGEMSYEFNILTLRRSLEYYKWLLTQV